MAVWPALIIAEVEQFPPEGQFAPVAAAREKSVPVPVRETDCGLPLALSAIDTLAERLPVAVGVNVTLTVQSFPIATLLQVSVSVKSPLATILVIFNGVVPGLCRVTDCAALVVPTIWLENDSLVGKRAMTGVFSRTETVLLPEMTAKSSAPSLSKLLATTWPAAVPVA